MHSPQTLALITLGIAEFLASVTRAPLASFIIVKMVDAQAMVVSLKARALAASIISFVLSRPFYHSLTLIQLKH